MNKSEEKKICVRETKNIGKKKKKNRRNGRNICCRN